MSYRKTKSTPIEACEFSWPQTEEELARSSADCDHVCQLEKNHKDDHSCCQGRATHPRRKK